jgi:hypothetical protein
MSQNYKSQIPKIHINDKTGSLMRSVSGFSLGHCCCSKWLVPNLGRVATATDRHCNELREHLEDAGWASALCVWDTGQASVPHVPLVVTSARTWPPCGACRRGWADPRVGWPPCRARRPGPCTAGQSEATQAAVGGRAGAVRPGPGHLPAPRAGSGCRTPARSASVAKPR